MTGGFGLVGGEGENGGLIVGGDWNGWGGVVGGLSGGNWPDAGGMGCGKLGIGGRGKLPNGLLGNGGVCGVIGFGIIGLGICGDEIGVSPDKILRCAWFRMHHATVEKVSADDLLVKLLVADSMPASMLVVIS